MINSSVGLGGANQRDVVTYVQKLLNRYIESRAIYVFAFLKVDGNCGPHTIACIKEFQSHIVGLANPDGRIDSNGRTIKALENYRSAQKQRLYEFSIGMPAPLSFTDRASASLPKKAAANSTTTVTDDPRKLMTRAAVAEAYGSISASKVWAKKSTYLKMFKIPDSITKDKDYAWVNVYDPKKRKVSKIWCHQAMHTFLDAALKNLQKQSLLGDLKEFGGSHAIRATRGTTNWSAHSWALAIDINMTGNGLGETPTMSKKFVKCFTDAGFFWGGNYSRKDGMHFTIAGFDKPRSS
ncbi:D-alanyl-D-alanine carboxypeptidase [Microbulbifer donghaiensis]|uniref:D-alanyl-D-alanine carboxypeptidase n=1 Tax=Microbulbifer donghaiensis TaxID=494016 RepID=A0A1M5A9M0_9GAMM|nr:M15 family metallopeptidase [Microbulbifer donghaiensis]SHF26787.1 D-alanyl-D-alanine carboxypeptidase [Microbulbifer donghaiensis]